jgi:hypothetical protein
MSPTDFGFAKLISMHDESFFANFAVFNVQPRFTVVLPFCVVQGRITNFLGFSATFFEIVRNWLITTFHEAIFFR